MDSVSASILCLALLLSSSAYSQAFLTEEAVTSLPGYDGDLPFNMSTGYITINETTQNNLFYYFIKSEKNASEDPLILWLTGGPGCSGFSGLVYEIGPIRYKTQVYNGSVPTLAYNPYSFTKIANIIFVDSPTGTGYSYSESSADYDTGNYETVDQLHIFLRKWLIGHPEYLSNPLYIAGDSYSGMIIPVLTLQLVESMEEGTELPLNLKGYFAGNPTSDNVLDAATVPFSHGMALISTELYKATEKSCKGIYYDPVDEECIKNIDIVDELLTDINEQHILEYYCGYLWSPKPKRGALNRRFRNGYQVDMDLSTTIPPVQCREYSYYLSYVWANDDSVKEALHVRNGTVSEWQRCSTKIDFTKQINSTIPYHYALLTKGYPALLYNGDHDMIIPYIATQAWIQELNFTIVDDWRPWYAGDQVGGYTRKFAHNLTYATVKGAGHTAPEFKPRECFEMFKRWITGKAL